MDYIFVLLMCIGIIVFILYLRKSQGKKDEPLKPQSVEIENEPQNKLRDVIVIADTKTIEWLKGKSKDEVIGFALNSCKAIADDVWTNIELWMQTTRSIPSIFNMPGTWDKSKCIGVIHEIKPEYKKLSIAVRTGTTGFGGKIALALCMKDSRSESSREIHQAAERQPTQQNNPFSEKILNFLDENPLSIGTLDEFKKGQEDFSKWGNGVLTGSKEWVVNKLCKKLSEIGVSKPPSISRSQNYQWQKSNLEGFTARIEASLPSMLAGYYIGRIGDNLYGLFGCNFNSNETESPASPVVKSIKLTEQGDAARGVSVVLVALRWDSNPISKQELRDRAARAVKVVDGQFDKDVMDVKILVIDETQQYVQLSVRADFRDKAEEERMRESLKKEFIK